MLHLGNNKLVSETLRQQILEITQVCVSYQETTDPILGEPNLPKLLKREVRRLLAENPAWSKKAVETLLFGMNEVGVTLKRTYPCGIHRKPITQVTYWKLRRK